MSVASSSLYSPCCRRRRPRVEISVSVASSSPYSPCCRRRRPAVSPAKAETAPASLLPLAPRCWAMPSSGPALSVKVLQRVDGEQPERRKRRPMGCSVGCHCPEGTQSTMRRRPRVEMSASVESSSLYSPCCRLRPVLTTEVASWPRPDR